MWMNEGEIEQAIDQFKSHPVLGKAANFLGAFRDEVNAHSDGWPYWRLPAKAAEKLMNLLHGQMYGGMGAYPRLPEPTLADVKKAIAPIKAFYAKRGNAAGMKFPELEPKPEPAKADTGREFDLHVWAKPETENMEALYTVSVVGSGAVCIDAPIHKALEYIRDEMERV